MFLRSEEVNLLAVFNCPGVRVWVASGWAGVGHGEVGGHSGVGSIDDMLVNFHELIGLFCSRYHLRARYGLSSVAACEFSSHFDVVCGEQAVHPHSRRLPVLWLEGESFNCYILAQPGEVFVPCGNASCNKRVLHFCWQGAPLASPDWLRKQLAVRRMGMVVRPDKGDFLLGFVSAWRFLSVFDCGRERAVLRRASSDL